MKKLIAGCIICTALWLGCGSDKEPPEVQITNPVNGSVVSGTVNVTAEASDNKSVERVEFYVDGSLASTSTSEPYSYSWLTTSLQDSSSHTIYVKAYDAAENEETSQTVSVLVYNGGGGSGQWQLVYSTDFSSDPGWITNNSSRFFYSSSDNTYYMESYQGSDEYAYTTSSWNSSSIKLEFDIRIAQEEWGSHVGLGIYDSDISTDGNFLEAHFGDDSGGKEACIHYRSENGLSYQMYYGDYQLNVWYHFILIYYQSSDSAILTITEKSSGNQFCSMSATSLGNFSGLTRIGFSNVGTTPYWSTFICKIDNIYYYNWVE
jgi:hypothetical protein